MSAAPPLSVRRQLFHFAWPVLIAQIAVMANGVIDTLMAGHLSALDLAAVGVGASIYATVFVSAMGVLLALTPVVAHHYGAGRYAEIGADVRQSAWLALLLSLLASALLHYPDPFLQFSRLTPELEIKVRAYLQGAAWGVPGSLFFRVYYGFATGIGQPRAVMMFNLGGVLLKIPLNWLLMYGHFGLPVLGSAGCGWSSAIVSWTVMLAAWIWCRSNSEYAGYGVFARFDPPRPKALLELLKLGLPMGGTFLVDVTAFTFMALFIARLGPAVSAAHQVAASVTIFVFMIPMSLGHATGVLVGQALGAGDHVRARRAGLLGVRVGIAVGGATGLLLWAAATPIAALYTSDPGVRAIAGGLLMLVAAYHVADALQTVVAQVLRGYKRATAPMAVYAISLWGVGLGGGYLLGLTDLAGAARGAAGFWLAGAASLALAASSLFFYFLRVSTAPGLTRR